MAGPKPKPEPQLRPDEPLSEPGAAAREFARAGQEAKNETHKERLEKLLRQPDMIEQLFAAPDKPRATADMTQDQYERLMNDPRYKHLYELVMTTWRNIAERVSEEIKVTGKSREEIYGKTVNALERLQNQLVTRGKSLKLNNKGRSRDSKNVSPDREVMDFAELDALRNQLDELERIDPKEIVRMLEDDKNFSQMLYEEMTKNHPTTQPVISSEEPLSIEETFAGGQDATRMLSLQNPNAAKNYIKLVRFINGEDEKSQKEVSDLRKNFERPLWTQIMRHMDRPQKKFLVMTYASMKSVEETKAFIQESIGAGTIRVKDIVRWKADEKAAKESGFFSRLDKPFMDSLSTVTEIRQVAQEAQQEYLQALQKPNLESAVSHYLTFNNFIFSRLLDIGALAVLVNLITNVSDRMNRRSNHDRREGAIQAFFLGLRDGVINRSTIFGITSTAVGLNGIQPFINDMIYSASGNEKEMASKNHQLVEYDELLSNRPQLAKFLVKNFDDMYLRAEQNRDNTHVGNEKEKRGKFGLWPADIMEYATPENALKLGYRDRARMGRDLFQVFRISTDVLNIKTKEDLEKHFTDPENDYLPPSKK